MSVCKALRIAVVFAVSGFIAACNTSSPSDIGMSQGASGTASYASATLPGDADLRQVAELPAPPDTAGGTEVPIAPSDTLDVFVFQVSDLSRTVQVDPSGNINLPLIGNVQAAGKPVRVLEQEITRAYARNYLQNPQVSVTVKESSARRVTIDGEVNKAGVYQLPPTASLIDAIALGGGFSRIADTGKVYVFRQVGNQKLVALYDVSQIRSGKRANPRIYGGDVVVVFSSSSKIAFQNLKEALGLASSASRIGVGL
ncbi:polysaccharide export protein [Tianweitania sp. BSSL-BM11]|uniref:Polysaccharide export protein n=1 Tax=Tianweitania aestuarii TaxID=2814886 RepID=A0ABS5RRF0_9HYPH|nr:polysaccharide biosynthesis/export family protein [Tianweitania aestuarii]MBS9719633.1 polysaccharide export protein [Tianweitania aestuarii]